MANEVTAVTINIKTAPHEQLDELMGGDDSGHFHMTEEEYNLMLRLVEKLREEDESEEEYYKLPQSEYDKLTSLFSLLYPDEDTDAEDALVALIDARVNERVVDIINGGEVNP